MIPSNEVRKPPPNPPPSLPSLRERLPELLSALKEAIRVLQVISPNASYLPAWVPLYEKAHSLKGLTRLLPCPEELRNDLILLSDTLGEAHHGNYAPRDLKLAVAALAEAEATLLSGGRLEWACDALKQSFQKEDSHEERLLKIPRPLQQINAIVSKKAFEATSLAMPMWILEEEMVLGDFTDWSKRMHSFLSSHSIPHGFVIHLAPHLISGSSAAMEAMAWFAVNHEFNEGLTERLRGIFPKARLKPCSA